MPARLNITDEERKQRHKEAMKKYHQNNSHYPSGVGIVYKLYSQNTDKIYIGSTTYKPTFRFASHKCVKNGTTSKEIVDLGNSQIMILETVEFGDCPQTLRDREYYYINSLPNVVNIVRKTVDPATGKYEYGTKYGTKYREKYGRDFYKAYYIEHKETYMDRQRERKAKISILRDEFQRLSAIQI